MIELSPENFPNGSAFLSPNGSTVQVVEWWPDSERVKVLVKRAGKGVDATIMPMIPGRPMMVQPVDLKGNLLEAPQVFPVTQQRRPRRRLATCPQCGHGFEV